MNTQQKIDFLVQHTKDYVKRAESKGLVVGVSGGVDSAVSGMIAALAVGEDNVLFVHMPVEGFERRDDYLDARALAQAAGATRPMEMTEIRDNHLFNSVSRHVFENLNLVRANVRARLRMVTLYGYANALNYMVIGTGNKTEHIIGYFTKYGDGATDFEPLADLWKWEVFELAKELGVPQSILNKAPSAGLWEGQTDEDELGITYKELDAYLEWRVVWDLHNMYDGYMINLVQLELLTDKYSDFPILPKLALLVEKRIAQNEHKNHTPPIFKLA